MVFGQNATELFNDRAPFHAVLVEKNKAEVTILRVSFEIEAT